MMKALFLLPAALAAFLPGKIQAQELTAQTSGGVRPALFEMYDIAFPASSETLPADYKDNKNALDAVVEKIAANLGAINGGELRIRVTSDVSPTGTSASSARAEARRRALVLKSYLIKNAGAREDNFITKVTTEGTVSDRGVLRVGVEPKSGYNDGTVIMKE